MQEVAEDLAPKIKTIQANLEVIKQFYKVDNLYNFALTSALNQYIIKCFPIEGQPSFN